MIDDSERSHNMEESLEYCKGCMKRLFTLFNPLHHVPIITALYTFFLHALNFRFLFRSIINFYLFSAEKHLAEPDGKSSDALQTMLTLFYGQIFCTIDSLRLIMMMQLFSKQSSLANYCLTNPRHVDHLPRPFLNEEQTNTQTLR